ncbi:MAG: hydrogenase maturation nickel metallochaperone HypA [Rhodospirillales bacterium]|jgi:hydrogenase nickel incorporation protein HypA/HybF|nr:hydrogenase maturation nickel metallochaperone HypA [Rhodospirillales bacterium]
MHEISICEGILQLIEEQAVEQNYKTVETIWLEIGPLAGVELEALRFGFDVVTKGSLAENAKLEIVETTGEAWCMPCQKSVMVAKQFDACPLCGSYQLQITGGNELRIKEMEVN